MNYGDVGSKRPGGRVQRYVGIQRRYNCIKLSASYRDVGRKWTIVTQHYID